MYIFFRLMFWTVHKKKKKKRAACLSWFLLWLRHRDVNTWSTICRGLAAINTTFVWQHSFLPSSPRHILFEKSPPSLTFSPPPLLTLPPKARLIRANISQATNPRGIITIFKKKWWRRRRLNERQIKFLALLGPYINAIKISTFFFLLM